MIILQITGGIVLLALAIWIEWGMTENSLDHWCMLGSSKPQWDARPLTENTHRGRLEVVPGDPVLSGNEITNIPLIVRNPGKVAVTIKAVRSRTRPVKLFGSTELDFDLLKRTPVT